MKKIFYRVALGDSVFNLSKRFGVPVGILISENLLKKEVEEGDLIVINKPCGKVYTVSVAETSKSVAEKFCMTEQELLAINNIPYVYFGMTVLVK